VKLRKLIKFDGEAIPAAFLWIVHVLPMDKNLQGKMMNL
jgi:hypothetical protein